jgi:hypothetical protein
MIFMGPSIPNADRRDGGAHVTVPQRAARIEREIADRTPKR